MKKCPICWNTYNSVDCGVCHNDPELAQSRSNMITAYKVFMHSARRLSENWDESLVKDYPNYLPSFDEFLYDMESMLKKELNLTITTRVEHDGQLVCQSIANSFERAEEEFGSLKRFCEEYENDNL